MRDHLSRATNIAAVLLTAAAAACSSGTAKTGASSDAGQAGASGTGGRGGIAGDAGIAGGGGSLVTGNGGSGGGTTGTTGGRGGEAAAGRAGAGGGGAKDGGSDASAGGDGAVGSAPKDGGAADAATGSSPARYKGVGFTGNTCADLDKLGVSWFYDWGTSSSCKTNAQFVPMIWGGWTATTNPTPPAKLASAGAKIILGFNEPDHADQAHLTVAAALALWPAMDQPAFERVGSPAAASDGQAWFEQFMTGVSQQSLRVDFIALHWYGWDAGSCANVSALESYIKWAEQWQRPLWLTEWSCRMQSAEVTRKFYDDAIAMFAKHPLVERYAWFLTRTADNADFSTATLLDAAGNPTALGTDYINAPAFR